MSPIDDLLLHPLHRFLTNKTHHHHEYLIDFLCHLQIIKENSLLRNSNLNEVYVTIVAVSKLSV